MKSLADQMKQVVAEIDRQRSQRHRQAMERKQVHEDGFYFFDTQALRQRQDFVAKHTQMVDSFLKDVQQNRLSQAANDFQARKQAVMKIRNQVAQTLSLFSNDLKQASQIFHAVGQPGPGGERFSSTKASGDENQESGCPT